MILKYPDFEMCQHLILVFVNVCFLLLSLTCLSHPAQVFTLQTESRDQKDGDMMVHHKLPLYVQHMDRLGDTELWDTNITVFIDDLLQLRWLSSCQIFLMLIVLTLKETTYCKKLSNYSLYQAVNTFWLKIQSFSQWILGLSH